MIAICKKPTKRLVKGARYEIEGLWNDGTNQRWLEGRVSITGIGRFKISNFTDEHGLDLPKINIIKPILQIVRLKFEELSKGDILVCTSDKYKTLVEGGMYRIESLIDKSTEQQGYSGKWIRTDHSIKLMGVPRALKFNAWSFRGLTSEELREISLSELLDGKEAPVIKKKPEKKINLMQNKDKTLIDILLRSIIDPNRHAITIPEWACDKVAPKLGLVNSDFDYIIDMSVRDIIDIMENLKK
jgi:hypothetical protein